jgi:hypothetical protein
MLMMKQIRVGVCVCVRVVMGVLQLVQQTQEKPKKIATVFRYM